MTTPETNNTAGHGTAIPNVTDGADGIQPISKEPTVNSVGQSIDEVDIEPITPARPVKYTEKKLAAHLTKMYGEAPVGMDLYDVWAVSDEEYRTKAEQDAAIHEAVQSQLSEFEPEAKSPAVEAWEARCKQAAQTHVNKVDAFEMTDRPEWADESCDWVGERAEISAYQSRPLIATTLSRISGVKDSHAVLKPAHFRLRLTRFLFDKEPIIEFHRMEQLDDDSTELKMNRHSRTQLTAREATALAHSLLAAVDLIEAGR